MMPRTDQVVGAGSVGATSLGNRRDEVFDFAVRATEIFGCHSAVGNQPE